MSIEELSLLNILFNLAIFFLLILIIYKISKDYLIPYLYLQIQIKEERDKELKESENLLDKTKDLLDSEILKQQALIAVLGKKVKYWENSILDENKKQEISNKEYLEKLILKRDIQNHNLKLLKIEKIAIPESIKQAYSEMRENYGGKMGLLLTKELIDKIKP